MAAANEASVMWGLDGAALVFPARHADSKPKKYEVRASRFRLKPAAAVTYRPLMPDSRRARD